MRAFTRQHLLTVWSFVLFSFTNEKKKSSNHLKAVQVIHLCVENVRLRLPFFGLGPHYSGESTHSVESGGLHSVNLPMKYIKYYLEDI